MKKPLTILLTAICAVATAFAEYREDQSALAGLPNLALGGTISGSVNVNKLYNNTTFAMSFDGDTKSYTQWNVTEVDLICTFAEPKLVNAIRILHYQQKRAPQTFKFQGLNENSQWEDLEVENGPLVNEDWVAGKGRYYKFNSSTSYSSYRLYVKGSAGKNSYTEIAEVEFYYVDDDAKIKIECEVTDYEGVYDGQPHGIDVVVKKPATGATVEYGLTDEGPWQSDPIQRTDFGETKVYVRVDAEKAEAPLVTNGLITVTQAENEWTVEPSLSKNRWKDNEPPATVSPGTPRFGDSVSVTYRRNGSEEVLDEMPAEAGGYTAVFTVEGTANYQLLEKILPFTIRSSTAMPQWEAVRNEKGEITGLTSDDGWTLTLRESNGRIEVAPTAYSGSDWILDLRAASDLIAEFNASGLTVLCVGAKKTEKDKVLDGGTGTLANNLSELDLSTLTQFTTLFADSTTDARGLRDCTALRHVTLPLSMTILATRCFQNCAALETVVPLDQIEELNPLTFYGCSSLTFSNGVAAFPSVKRINGGEKYNNSVFYSCDQVTSVVLGSEAVDTLDISNFVVNAGAGLTNVSITAKVITNFTPTFNTVEGGIRTISVTAKRIVNMDCSAGLTLLTGKGGSLEEFRWNAPYPENLVKPAAGGLFTDKALAGGFACVIPKNAGWEKELLEADAGLVWVWLDTEAGKITYPVRYGAKVFGRDSGLMLLIK